MLSTLKNLLQSYTPQYPLASWPVGRGYDMAVPQGIEGEAELPLIIAIHGYTQDSRKMRNLTSPTGDPLHPNSLDSLAQRHKILVAYPNGTPIRILPGRCWNAGGGQQGYAAVADPARRSKVDDLAYFQDLLSDIQSRWNVDKQRIYLLGISNGGAMAQRLATETPHRWAAVASVAACNQYAASAKVKGKGPVPLLFFHGTADTIWPYYGGHRPQMGVMESVESTLAMWSETNDCQERERVTLHQPRPDDPTTIEKVSYRGMTPRSDIDFYKIVSGGHAWPGGEQYMTESIIGFVTHRISANELAWEFFKNHTLE